MCLKIGEPTVKKVSRRNCVSSGKSGQLWQVSFRHPFGQGFRQKKLRFLKMVDPLEIGMASKGGSSWTNSTIPSRVPTLRLLP